MNLEDEVATHGTPLVSVRKISTTRALWIKLESLNPSGSVFDRVADEVLRAHLHIEKPMVVGGGSLALAFARAAARRGVSLLAALTGSPLAEHIQLLEQHGVRVFTRTSIAESEDIWLEKLCVEQKTTIIHGPKRANLARNVMCETLGKELLEQVLELKLRRFSLVCPVNHGAVLGGILDAFQRYNKGLLNSSNIEEQLCCFAFGTIRPNDHTSIQDGVNSFAEIEPLGHSVELVPVQDRDALMMRFHLARDEGILVGLASAAATYVAISKASLDMPAICIVVDAGDRYFSVEKE